MLIVVAICTAGILATLIMILVTLMQIRDSVFSWSVSSAHRALEDDERFTLTDAGWEKIDVPRTDH